MRTSRVLITLVAGLAAVTTLSAPAAPAVPADGRPAPSRAALANPEQSTFFSTAAVDPGATVGAPAIGDNKEHGDLWPSCWSDDDHVYTAYGDGVGFGDTWHDIGVARISGMPGNLTGTQKATGDRVGRIWGDPAQYYRKPTGMVCVDGDLYLAVQDLKRGTLDHAPSATIVKSTDKGATWTSDRTTPMFSDEKFTTVMFLDHGKDNANSPDGYVYAYGLDHNWRDTFDPDPDPVDLYLARVPATSIQDRSTWQFYAGDSGGTARWTSSIDLRVPVLHDDRRIYRNVGTPGRVRDLSMLSQGGVVYNKALDRYLYTSWTEYTFEFYEAPTPWGPWKHFTPKDFGGYPWTHTKHGGYATTIPSKYISADGTSMWLQSNVCPCGGGYPAGDFWAYTYSLRRLSLTPAVPTTPGNGPDATRNLAREDGTVPVERATHFGTAAYNDGDTAQNEDDWNDERKTTSWWGYTWPRQYHLNRVAYTTGRMFGDGGWFSSAPRVQVRRDGVWTDVTGQSVTPSYPTSSAAGTNRTYVFDFDTTSGDGVRIVGGSGGTQTFTSIAELEVHHR
ncbi:hypothetical protein GCM10010451_46770 [Streptomyces virens]|uniref:DUF4185 domain-containing protein n=2 Tax=Streptomyces TaxID=1883 RepID=A0AA40VGT7_9ACTN|nr:DUF4185 domain-containing protein [Streptomyces calvus]MBA8945407.1 hypothetical protein [Streptomyces calvus]MBA8980016.1 hypothetical protein [Streptomyces calvus]GGP60651.1 hypothetical protein GCM10010247_36750 [Streptomyces calvus]